MRRSDMQQPVSILFTRRDSIYKELCADCWDIDRDARHWPGGNPCVAHPPCRAWGQLAHFANPRPDEKDLAIWAVAQIRKNGGVLEHPRASRLWQHLNLPMPGTGRDQYGGFSLSVNQSWWGHMAEKKTLLYICGCSPKDLPVMPLNFNAIQYTIGTSKKRDANYAKRECPKKVREETPLEFAKWLISVAEKCKSPIQPAAVRIPAPVIGQP